LIPAWRSASGDTGKINFFLDFHVLLWYVPIRDNIKKRREVKGMARYEEEGFGTYTVCMMCGGPSYGKPYCRDCYCKLKTESEGPSKNTQVIVGIIAFIIFALGSVAILREGYKMEEEFRRDSQKVEMMVRGRLDALDTPAPQVEKQDNTQTTRSTRAAKPPLKKQSAEEIKPNDRLPAQ